MDNILGLTQPARSLSSVSVPPSWLSFPAIMHGSRPIHLGTVLNWRP